ncbi:ferritin-like domain-containing protein [Actinomyces sp. B33]|uniref:ferritin-like fold-containing protein n=1 Tax=Actinomyces sp. B33 TaxID=2942131 RepID=UPI002341F464|nr:ferritin-like fold-containing protein [Actinomyces sp. B33]MDC4233792.1 ferritin-like domain-containing protein [Actinomyces sp. B33]
MASHYAPVAPRDADVVGLLAYSALAAMTRLAKDGDQAPSIRAHIEHARMSARAFTVFEQLETWAGHRGFDLHSAADAFSGMYDDLDARTRPTTWHERLIKTYVTAGILGDMLHEVAARHGLFQESDDQWDLGEGDWVREHMASSTAADEQLAARLSLWARRVAGEVLGLVRSTLFTHPDLALTPEAMDEIVEAVTARHGERMGEIHLKA